MQAWIFFLVIEKNPSPNENPGWRLPTNPIRKDPSHFFTAYAHFLPVSMICEICGHIFWRLPHTQAAGSFISGDAKN